MSKYRGRGITEDEEKIIVLGLQRGKSAKEIANFLDRAPQSIYKRIDRMKSNGRIDQLVADLGQYDE